VATPIRGLGLKLNYGLKAGWRGGGLHNEEVMKSDILLRVIREDANDALVNDIVNLNK
jgi:hypothetical protein